MGKKPTPEQIVAEVGAERFVKAVNGLVGTAIQDYNEGRLNVCIEATRIVCGVLGYYGFEAEPLPVEVRLFNARFVELVEERGRMPLSDEETQEWWADGAYALGLGVADTPPEPGGWVGHMMALVRHAPSGLLGLADPTLMQASRPEHGLKTMPTWLPINEEWLAETADPQTRTPMTYMDDEQGSILTVYQVPENTSYKAGTAWTSSIEWGVGSIVRKINDTARTSISLLEVIFSGWTEEEEDNDDEDQGND